jgi:hypothetical protein
VRNWLLQGLAPLLAGLAILAGLIALGKLVTDRLRGESRYQLAFADIQCEPPVGLSRQAFLAEVQYEAEMPDHLSLLERDLLFRVKSAFEKHPWVEKVASIRRLPNNLVVQCVFRKPVLALPGTPPRAVDAAGVLLPRNASVAGLIRLDAEDLPVGVATGAVHSDARVRAAARVAGILAPHQARLKLISAAVRDGEVELRSEQTRLLWGRPPGEEKPGEAPAGLKRDRLLEQLRKKGTLDQDAIDLRPAQRPTPPERTCAPDPRAAVSSG